MKRMPNAKHAVGFPILFLLLLAAPTVLYGAGVDHGGPWGTRYQHGTQLNETPKIRKRAALTAVRHWSEIALDANAIDHRRTTPEQLGPLRTARALAIFHIAAFDAVNAIDGRYRGYPRFPHVSNDTSMDAAIAQAAHDTLTSLFPSQAANFAALLAEELSRVRDGRAKRNGIDLGRRSAAAILALRADDGSQHQEQLFGTEYIPAVGPNKWRQDPVSDIPIALGSRWGELVTPFVLKSADQFPVAPPPAPGTAAFVAAFDEVRNLGGCGTDLPACAIGFDGATTPTLRSAEQTQIGLYWGYDGTPGLGTPPRLYNQIALKIAEQKGSNVVELARLLALINVAMADAGLVAWKAKYDYEFARPITAIRDAGQSSWTPLGAPASNKIGPNFTPPFPAFTSGHATFGAVLFQILRRFYHNDNIAFTFVSDEFNGVTKDNNGNVRPLVERSYSSLSQAEEENGQSRIYLGIHWAFDKTEGIAQGRRVADFVMKHAFEPVNRR